MNHPYIRPVKEPYVLPIDRPAYAGSLYAPTRRKMIESWGTQIRALQTAINRVWAENTVMRSGFPQPIGRDLSRWQVEAEGSSDRIRQRLDIMLENLRVIEVEVDVLARAMSTNPNAIPEGTMEALSGPAPDPVPDIELHSMSPEDPYLQGLADSLKEFIATEPEQPQ